MTKVNAKINLLEKKVANLQQNMDALYDINLKQAKYINHLNDRINSIDAPLILEKKKK